MKGKYKSLSEAQHAADRRTRPVISSCDEGGFIWSPADQPLVSGEVAHLEWVCQWIGGEWNYDAN